ncbi:MAG TPA: pirin family protein [Solimonas sp.]|nr:pirin family protein [Solimonas sp.]
MSKQPLMERIAGSGTTLGEGMHITRALPTRHRRLVGAWCFLDHFGPTDASSGRGLRVGPHPHIGLQTVTWLLEGEIVHRDSLGSLKAIRPGQLNLMTAGRGICHSEESPPVRPARLHGAQLWIAQPESARHGEPDFVHHAKLPVVQRGQLCVTLLAGTALGERSPAAVATPLVGMELRSLDASDTRLPLDPAFEYAALVLQGTATLESEFLGPGTLLYLGQGRESLRLNTEGPAVVLLIGGEPFAEETLMWWNFVGRSQEELTQACRDWNAAAAYFGTVAGYDGGRLVAPMPPWAIHGA